MSVEPSDIEIIRRAMEASRLQTHTCAPGQVVSYDGALQTCSVRPAVLNQRYDSETDPEFEAMPVLEDVPVCWLSGGGFFIHMPLAANDPCMIHFCEEDPAIWFEKAEIAPPRTLRRHGLHAWVVPGCRPKPDVIGSVGAGMTLGQDGGTLITIGEDIQLAGTTALALSTKVATELNALKDAISNAATVPNDGGAAFKAAIVAALSAWPGDLAAEKVKGS